SAFRTHQSIIFSLCSIHSLWPPRRANAPGVVSDIVWTRCAVFRIRLTVQTRGFPGFETITRFRSRRILSAGKVIVTLPSLMVMPSTFWQFFCQKLKRRSQARNFRPPWLTPRWTMKAPLTLKTRVKFPFLKKIILL
ncbi:MAG: hypothetical protein WC378_16610, partial [Opitutaceae bacterium]